MAGKKKQPSGVATLVSEIKCRNGFRFSLNQDEQGDHWLGITEPDGRYASISTFDGRFLPAEVEIIGSFLSALG